MYSAVSSLAWSESPGATSSTYHLERRSRRSSRSPNPATRLPRMRCAVIGAALLTGGAAMLVGAQTVVVSPPPKPLMAHDVSTLATRDRLSKEEADLRAEIQAYTSLTDNWDGEGAAAPPAQAVRDAIAFLGGRPDGIPLPLPEVASIGDVGIYWDEDGIFAEVQFGGDRAYSYYAQRKVARDVVEEYGNDGIALAQGWPQDMVQLLRQFDKS